MMLLTVLLLIGCSNKEDTTTESHSDNNDSAEIESGETPTKGGEAVFAYSSDVSNYDPIKGSSGADHSLLWPVYETLIKFTPELEPEPGLAESWEFIDDTTLELQLREGVTFHDGTPFNADAVKFNIERINSEESNVSDLHNIEKVEVVDEYTVKFILTQPDSSLILALSDRGGMMVSPTAVTEKGEDFSRNPIGSGPYKLVNHVLNGEIVLEAFEDYWQEGVPYLDRMTIKVMADENTRINALKSGEVDFAYNIKPGNTQNLESDPNIVLSSKTNVAFRILWLNSDKGDLDKKAVRQAINIGINREELINAINFGVGEPAHQPFPMEYWAADKDLNIEYNPEKAKDLLKEAGVESVTFDMNHYSNAYEQRLAEAIKSQLNEIGIEVELQAMELNAAVSNYFSEKEASTLLASWTGRPDPQMTINYLFSNESFYNVGSNSTDEIEDLIAEAAVTYDQKERAKLSSEISRKTVLEEAIMVPLFFEPQASALNKSLKGYESNMLGKPIFSTTWKE